MYQRVKANYGHRYLKDGKFCKPSDVPEVEKRKLEQQCIFCGAAGTKQRYCNQLIVELCDEHYYAKSIGKIAEKLREGIPHG